ncbi:hypothetical protein KIN20_005975 [Parelaphostrongylus tenuis]|uniref:Amidase domain-containing protein n=1 Tax=Parelaphostrongylus tenuis TaxID=148309 RepID=A0AAD5QFJ6_PARTN|nr:hypothetical protein KIN20_005975 [Parelaphostrongylus tenuis]
MTALSPYIYVISRLYFLLVTFVFYVVNLFKTKQCVPPARDHLLFISASEAVKKIARKEITSRQLIEAYIHRIEQVNDLINAVVVKLFDDAINKAEEIDRQIAASDDNQLAELTKRCPLLGVPFSVKDAMEVDGQVITCGVYSQKDIKCSSTAESIKRMEAAGAILIAITNVPEACFWLDTANGIYGQTNNPYDVRRSAGGSSGGEGALIGAAGSVIGVGSDIGGSIRIPSFMNGIFGMKPTPGVIPLDGHVPPVKGYKQKMLRVGPMCRYVEDIPLLIEVMGGDRALDLNLRDTLDFRRIRIYYMEGIQNVSSMQTLSDEMRSALLEAVTHFEKKYDIEAIRLDLPLMTFATEMFSNSLKVEGEPKTSELFKSLKGDKGRLDWTIELPKLLVGHSVHTPGALFASLFESMDKTTEEQRTEFLRLRDRLIRQITEVLGDDGILFFPSWPQSVPYHHQSVFTPFDTAYTGVFNALALPVIECPMGLDTNGLPLGVQIVGSLNSDRLLVAAATEISASFGGWTSV